VDAQKRQWLEQNKLSCIEIDLRKHRWRPDHELETAILRTAPRRWISHREKRVPEPPMPLGKAKPSGGSPKGGRIPSSTSWYAAQTAKEFPDLNERWRAFRKRLGLE
jgi:hypothetical protein